MQIRLWDNNLKVRLIGDGLFNMLFWMYFPFITVYFGSAMGNHIAGLLMTVPPVFSMLGSLLGGALADRLGRRPVMLTGALFQTVMFALFAISTSHWIEFLAFIGLGLGGAFYKPASSAMVADLVPPQDRRQVFATFMTANNIGAVLGPALGAVFFFHYREGLLWTCTFVMLLYFICIYYLVHETLPFSNKSLSGSNSITVVFKQQWKGYGIIFRDRIFLVYILAGIFSLIPIMQLDLYMPVYVIDEVPEQTLFPWTSLSPVLASTEIYGWLVGFNGLLFVLFILPVTKWFQNWKERDIFILSSLLSGIGTFAIGLNSNIWFLFFITIIFTFGEIFRTPVTQSFISRYAPEHARGQYMGMDSLQNTISKFLAPMTVFLSNWVPPMGIFSIILILALISIVFYVQLFRLFVEQPEATGKINI
ncbi:Predicted arabinose efflux permease, MFS family [Paenibacillus sp. UNCCL117]|uniref:MDR family MFS transporter n=1 Tax=unclassified Paenibacillus TaxID=185978 RepID=UPI00088D0030|nr:MULTISPECIES: MFS transporter [unclassified Paenibacillus]SDE28351.1 Predicted arabinose efflux permease, MFS family [Paenibacillus sp. cl123]SFW63501.1 Predicted arabinose efflux permease, MFS family [Paenibacillus sp. UNCCL117]